MVLGNKISVRFERPAKAMLRNSNVNGFENDRRCPCARTTTTYSIRKRIVGAVSTSTRVRWSFAETGLARCRCGVSTIRREYAAHHRLHIAPNAPEHPETVRSHATRVG